MSIRDCENNVKLIGYVCTNVEQIDTDPLGIKFKLITNEVFYSKKKQQSVKNSEAHLVKSWKQNATFALNNIKIGDHIYVDGKIHYHIIITDDNRKIRNPEIIASKISKLNRKNNTEKDETVKDIEPKIVKEETVKIINPEKEKPVEEIEEEIEILE